MDFHPNKTKFNIREGIKLFELGTANPDKASGSLFWQEVEREQIIP